MSIFESRPYRILSTLADYILLDVLWLIACVPVVTIFPATAAMFGVIRDRTRGRHESVSYAFVSYFKENFKLSLAISIPWFLFGCALAADYLILLRVEQIALKIPLIVLLTFGALVYAATSVFLFPTMVNYRSGWRSLLRNSLLFGLSKPFTSVACIAVVLLAAAAISFVPLSALVLGSGVSYFVYRACDRTFREIDKPSQNSEPAEPDRRR